MIRLTGFVNAEAPVFVNPEMMDTIGIDLNGTTSVGIGNKSVLVTESPEEVARKVLDYKLLMEQYRACQHNQQIEDAGYVQNDLMELAGLENTKTGGTTE